ncbi:MAG: hypothetical protein ABI875_00205 [Gemmatimonadales bacterium]
MLVGVALALVALSFVLYPLLFDSPLAVPSPGGPAISAADAGRNAAMEALREIEFDRETGKLSDKDYEALRSTYTQRAVEIMRGGIDPACARCGPRPEHDAVYCSNCGAPIAA